MRSNGVLSACKRPCGNYECEHPLYNNIKRTISLSAVHVLFLQSHRNNLERQTTYDWNKTNWNLASTHNSCLQCFFFWSFIHSSTGCHRFIHLVHYRCESLLYTRCVTKSCNIYLVTPATQPNNAKRSTSRKPVVAPYSHKGKNSYPAGTPVLGCCRPDQPHGTLWCSGVKSLELLNHSSAAERQTPRLARENTSKIEMRLLDRLKWTGAHIALNSNSVVKTCTWQAKT